MLKNRIRKNFSKLPNAIIEDKNLSINAKALFWYLASRPEYWVFNNKNIQDVFDIKDPRTIAKYIKELLKSGWISRGRIRSIDGRLTGNYDYIINEKPFAKDSDSKDSSQSSLSTLLESDFVQEINGEEAIEKTLQTLPEETKKFAQDFENKSLVSQSVLQDILQDFDTKNAPNNASECTKNTNLEDDNRMCIFPVYAKNAHHNNKELINNKEYIKKIKKINKKTKKDSSLCKTNKSKQPVSKSKEDLKSELLNLSLPSNVGREMWAEFIAFRNEMKKPLTLRGAKMALSELSKFDPSIREEALRQSIIHNWSGIYEPKSNAFANVGNKNSFGKNNATDPLLLKKLEAQGSSFLDVVRGKEVYIDNQRVIATRKPQGNYVLGLANNSNLKRS